MTANELIRHLNFLYGMDNPWPPEMEVDAETYGNCCQLIFENLLTFSATCGVEFPGFSFGDRYVISLGHNKGLMFKGIELRIKK